MSGFAQVLETAGLYSLARSRQLRAQLNALAEVAGWNGVVSGLDVYDNGGVSVLIGAGTLISQGVEHTEDEATVYNGLPSDGTSTLFLRVDRTANPNPLDQTTLDTYDLAVDDNTTGALPAADVGWFAVAQVVTASGDIVSITPVNSTPAPLALPAGTTRIRPAQSFIIPPDTQHIVYGSFINEGTLITMGDRYRLDF
jgi:hypothetical protein